MSEASVNHAVLDHALPAHPFPLAVLAESPRASVVIIMRTPFYVAQQLHRQTPTLARRQAMKERLRRVVVELEPATLLHVNGTRWRCETPPPRMAGALAATVRAACDFLGCAPTRKSVVERVIDAYPEIEPRLRPIVRSRQRDDRLRAMQPLLAAMLVAHAASVAHVMKHG